MPGGKAAYPSSVLMNAVPAKVAGVRELIMASPNPNPLVLAAAALAGVDRVLGIGGAQAIGALAYGTKSIPRVDKIVGPGNAYVAEAKRQVFGEVGIDMVAGPSEILVIADGSAPADWVAMDLFSQAEHDESAQAILLSPDEKYLDAVAASIQRLLVEMPRRDVIAASLKARGALILTRDLEEACAVANRIAPEHLELAVAEPEQILAPECERAQARSSSAAGARRPSATTAPVRTTCCRPPARRASRRRSACTTSRSEPASSAVSKQGAQNAGSRRRHAGRGRRVERARARSGNEIRMRQFE